MPRARRGLMLFELLVVVAGASASACSAGSDVTRAISPGEKGSVYAPSSPPTQVSNFSGCADVARRAFDSKAAAILIDEAVLWAGKRPPTPAQLYAIELRKQKAKDALRVELEQCVASYTPPSQLLLRDSESCGLLLVPFSVGALVTEYVARYLELPEGWVPCKGYAGWQG